MYVIYFLLFCLLKDVTATVDYDRLFIGGDGDAGRGEISYELLHYVVRINSSRDDISNSLRYIPINPGHVAAYTSQYYLRDLVERGIVNDFRVILPEYKYSSKSMDRYIIKSVTKPFRLYLTVGLAFKPPDIGLSRMRSGNRFGYIFYGPKGNGKGYYEDIVSRLAHDPHVLFIEPLMMPRVSTYDAKAVTGIGTVSSGISGLSSQVISIGDTGVDRHHCSFYDPGAVNEYMYDGSVLELGDSSHGKIHSYISVRVRISDTELVESDRTDFTTGHGSHVSSVAVGSPRCGEEYIGVSSGSKLIVIDMSNSDDESFLYVPDDFYNLLQSVYDAGSRIFSASFGVDTDTYGLFEEEIDRFVYEHDDFNFVVAAGNSGDFGEGTINSPGIAKNVITVGATINSLESFKKLDNGARWDNIMSMNDVYYNPDVYDTGSVCAFSSKGPTTDGRIKPDVVAPGMFILGANAQGPGGQQNRFTYKQGTSQSTPLVAGIVALIIDHLDAVYHISRPTSSLIKAILVLTASPVDHIVDTFISNSGNYLKTTGRARSSSSGFGATNMTGFFGENSGHMTFEDRVELQDGEQLIKCMVVSENNTDAKFVLSWIDRPAHSVSSRLLVDDVDMYVHLSYPGGTHRDVFPNGRDNFDSVNNVQVISLPGLPVGTTVTLYLSSGDRVDSTPLSVSLAYYNSGMEEYDDDAKCTKCATESGLTSCPIASGVGVSRDCGYTCVVQSCKTGFYADENRGCIQLFNTQNHCHIEFGSGVVVDGTCMVTTCDNGFYAAHNSCLCYTGIRCEDGTTDKCGTDGRPLNGCRQLHIPIPIPTLSIVIVSSAAVVVTVITSILCAHKMTRKRVRKRMV